MDRKPTKDKDGQAKGQDAAKAKGAQDKSQDAAEGQDAQTKDQQPQPSVFTVSDETLEQLAVTLRTLHCESAFDLFCKRGHLVLEVCHGGSMDRYRSRNARKPDSIRRLVALSGGTLKRSVIVDSIQVYDACRRMPTIRQLPNIMPSHVVSATRLRDEQALEMLGRASRERWTVAHLDRAITEDRRARLNERRGNPGKTPSGRAVTCADRCVTTATELQRALACVESFDEDDLPLVKAAIRCTIEVLQDSHDRLDGGAPDALPARDDASKSQAHAAEERPATGTRKAATAPDTDAAPPDSGERARPGTDAPSADKSAAGSKPN